MADWNSTQYLKFKNYRTQPARDLASRIAGANPNTIVDIGCGTGNSTRILREIFPKADILGIDSSPNMLDAAARENPDLSFRLCDATALDGKYDILFSNACLQWIPNHNSLLPTLMSKLNDGGILAVQMPKNGDEPLYRLIKEVTDDPKWGFECANLQNNKTLSPEEYYNILFGCSSSFEIWESRYYHHMPNHRALIEWVKGTKLRPYLDLLGKEKARMLEAELVYRLKDYYPLMSDGSVLFGFRRLFFTAYK